MGGGGGEGEKEVLQKKQVAPPPQPSPIKGEGVFWDLRKIVTKSVSDIMRDAMELFKTQVAEPQLNQQAA